ncbi:hypothetical protein N7532_001648 [Penicillium argentinense]|uniref:Uncharacterized protein n=1 Tax=Penicillium argentinense TaxID=1131581 RepID=A0A9W9G305_9EURO|nr:uncharacterized protein N7532_001648 [Penicillium argentinense]KAJ5111113.1 hypothetical protein N7532_001648 [Penicillium argentinense]
MICGSQGSGKSHTLSCILENSLIKSLPVGKLTSPLAGLVFHYDKFTGFTSTQLCEAAYLCSAKILVRILVSPTNFVTMKDLYSQAKGLSPKHHLITVKPMFIPPESLTTAMMKTLMGVDNKSDCPLYIEILREMATADQGRQGFNYTLFRQRIDAAPFKDGQLAPLKVRLSILESFLSPATSTCGFSDQPPTNFDA